MKPGDLNEIFDTPLKNRGYRCLKCEGKNVSEHGIYCKGTNRLTE